MVFTVETNGAVVELVFADDTAGWIIKQNNAPSDLGVEAYQKYITATGGTVTESGDFKIHTFTGDGCFVVSCAGNPLGADTLEVLAVGGGGGGGSDNGGGGGAGSVAHGPSIPVSTTTYPITVGAGGTGRCRSL